MPSLVDARKSLNQYLNDMNLDPHNLIISEYDSETEKDFWLLHGSFQQGFLGDVLVFDAKYRYDADSISKCETRLRDT